jgi:hypothetical protein
MACQAEQDAYNLAQIDEAIAAANVAIAMADYTIASNAYQSAVTARMAALYALYACQMGQGGYGSTAPQGSDLVIAPMSVEEAIKSREANIALREQLIENRQVQLKLMGL